MDAATKNEGHYRLEGGGFLAEKPEYLTELAGAVLVPKDDARIRLRGELDLLMSELLKVQVRACALGCQRLVDDLEDIAHFIGALSRAEVLNEPFAATTTAKAVVAAATTSTATTATTATAIDPIIAGVAYHDIREVSHNPKRFFGRGHLFGLSYTEGELPVALNALRALSRRCELVFYEAFKAAGGDGGASGVGASGDNGVGSGGDNGGAVDPGGGASGVGASGDNVGGDADDGSAANAGTTRPDLMEGYNRLSSILYILCLRAVTGGYESERTEG